MNTVDLRRTGRRGAACAAVAAFALFGANQASAEVANPTLIPAQSAYIISVPDASAFWNAWEANSLYDAYKKVMAMPEVKDKVSNFTKELTIVESSLGFKLDGKTLSQVFSSADIYIRPADGDKTEAVGLMKVADKEKLQKLLDLAEKAASKAGADDDTSGTAAADDATSAIAQADYKGATIKTMKGDNGSFIYSQVKDFFVFGSTDAGVKTAIDRINGSETSGTVAQSEDFKKIDAALASHKGEVYVYGDQEIATKMSAKDAPAKMFGPLKGFISDVAPIALYGASLNFEPKEISSYSYAMIAKGSDSSMVVKNPGDKPLAIANYIPENTMLTFATSLFNAQELYDLATGVAKGTGNDLDKKMSDAETFLGFSIKNDFVPALGNEIGFALNDVKFGGLIPTVDATIMFSVKDKDKMAKVAGGLENLATNAMAAKSGKSGADAPKFEKTEIEGETLNTMQIPGLTGLAPGYVLTDNYFFIGSNKDSLTNALMANKTGKNLPNSEALKSLGHDISSKANTLQFANMSRIWDVAQQITGAIPAAKSAAKYIDVLRVIDMSGSSSHVENGAIISQGVVKLK